jgi:hypothetical protein
MLCIDRGVAVALACLPVLAWAATGDAALVERGERLYYGTDAAYARPGIAQLAGAALPAQAAACVACHRRSGLGSAESDLVVPPIAGHLLFNPLAPQTGQRLPWPSRDRVRPAYDAASLAHALRTGVAPDGKPIGAPMPRYAFTDAEVAALAAYLETLSASTAPGVTDEEVVFATVTTPDVAAQEVDDLLRVLRAYLADRNAGTRHETRRRAQALRTDSIMYRRFRRWRIEHWPLAGPPATWSAQLEARYAAQPVFALLSGLSYDDWTPVHEFCERRRVPCLLPSTPLPPAREDFYSVYFAPGLAAEADAIARALADAGVREAVVWTGETAAGESHRAAVARALARHGVAVASRAPRADDTLVAALAAAQIEARWAALGEAPQRVVVAGATLGAWPHAWRPADATLRARATVATPLADAAQAQRQLARARAWFASRRLSFAVERVAVEALFAAMVANESLVHVDDRFSREYCLEKLEHNLENTPPLTAYRRLAIGPNQRFAARTVDWRPALGSAAAATPGEARTWDGLTAEHVTHEKAIAD